MRKVRSVLLSFFVALFCCFLSVNVGAVGVLGTGMCGWDCDEISSEHAQKLAKALFDGDTDTFYNAKGNCNLLGCSDKGYAYYQENLHCQTCSNNSSKILYEFSNLCREKCNCLGDECDGECLKSCTAPSRAVMKQDMANLKEVQNALDGYINALSNVECYAESILSNAAGGASIGAIAGTIIPGVGTALGALIGTAVGVITGIIKAATGGATFPPILNAFLSVGESGCWFCPIFDTIYNAANALATNIYVSLRELFLSLLALGGFAWILFTVLKFITTIHGPNIGEFMTTLFKGLGTILLVAIFLTPSPSFLSGYLVDVPANVALTISGGVLNAMGSTKNDTITYQTSTANDACGSSYSQETHTVKLCQASDASKYEGMVLSATLHDEFICLLKRFSTEMIVGMAIGATFVTEGITGGALRVLPQFAMLFSGVLVFISYFALFIIIPFKLIDLILRICFVIILMPVFVICYAFPATRGYTKKGWDLFLSCWVTLIALCVFISFALALMASIWSSTGTSD